MSNYNVDTLEDKIIVEAQEAIKNLESIIGHVKDSKDAVDSLKNATGLKTLDTQAKAATSSLDKLQAVVGVIKKALNFGALVYGAKKAFDFMKGFAENSINYVETLNLFEVSMGKTLDQFGNLDKFSSQYYTKAIDFQERLNKAFGTNIEETMRYQALYNQMSKSAGIGNNASYIMSENLTKLGIDLASLFNKDESATMEALRAGVLAGQTKPLRNYGLDVTQQSLAPLLGDLGIDRSVSELSQAEKMILRYIAVLKQASAAHGDFAKTIESPANQLKILKSQFQELKTAIGNLFQGLLGQILPYVNAVVMVLKELVKMIGALFGFEVSSSNTNLAERIGVDDLNEGLGGAVGAAKELKAQIMGFDNINNITTETSSGGGGGGISSNGIDSKLLDGLKEYDNLMDKVRTKANEIKDAIMKWLGFTGDVEHDTQRLKEILDTIDTILKAIAITWLGTKIIGFIGNIINAIGQGGVLGAVSKLQLAVGAIAASWATAKLAAKEYVKFFTDDPEGNAALKAMGYTALSIGSGAVAGASIGSLIAPGIGTGIGAIVGATAASIGVINETKSESEKKALQDLQKQLEEEYDGYVKVAKSIKERPEIASQMGLDYNTTTENIKGFWNIGSDEFNEKTSEMIDMYRNLAYAAADLFDNGGIKIDTYYQKYVNMVNEITKSSDTWLTLYNSYTSNNEALDKAIESLDIYISKLSNSAYKTTAEDIANINDILNQMGNYVKASGDAFIDAAIASTKSLQSEGYISKETADLVVANAIRKAEAEGNAFEAYKLGLQDLTTQLKNGTITQDEYNERQQELFDKWQGSLGTLDEANTKLDNLHSTISSRIDMGSWDSAREYITKFGETFDSSKEKMATARDSMIEFYDDSIEYAKKELKNAEEINGIESEQYKEAKERLQGLQDARTATLDKYDKDVQNLKETTYKNLKILEQQIINSGYDIEKDSEGIYKSVQDQLNKIGLDTDVAKNLDKSLEEAEQKVESHQKGISDKLGLITKNLDGTFSFKFDAKADYSSMLSKLKEIRRKIEGMSSNSLVAPMFSGMKIALNNIISRIENGYAEGGFPDMGEIFVAREAGPELVGRIGRRTAVANNAQIVEAVSRGVYDAVSAAMQGGTTTVQLDVRADEGIIVRKASQGFTEHVMQTGELPFPVPV